MSITASGLFGLTLEKMMIDTLSASVESETDLKVAMILDTATPDFDTHDFWADLSGSEVSGTNYTAGGNTLTSTEVTLSGGVLKYDAADAQWTSSTISNAMASVIYFPTAGAGADELLVLHDFGTAASTSNGTFDLIWHTSGIFTLDYTP